MTKLCDVLGLTLEKKEEILDEEIENLIAERQAARKAKDFARADEIRGLLLDKGIELKDTREGVKMETNLIQLKELFHLEDQDLRSYSPLTLAYIGDGVYELIIRTILVKKGNCPVNRLHKKASSLVKAGAQSAIMEVIEEELTPEELSVYRRGRNAHSPTMAKHATMADYRRATGFEALMGYLYLKEDYTRMLTLVRMGIGEDIL